MRAAEARPMWLMVLLMLSLLLNGCAHQEPLTSRDPNFAPDPAMAAAVHAADQPEDQAEHHARLTKIISWTVVIALGIAAVAGILFLIAMASLLNYH